MNARYVALAALLVAAPLANASAAPAAKKPTGGTTTTEPKTNGNTPRSCGDATGMTASLFYVTCLGATEGNIEGSDNDLTGLSGQWTGEWSFVQKFTFDPAGNSGTLTFNKAITSRFVLGVKTSSYYSLYLYDGSKMPGGSDDEFWQTIGTAANANNGGANISHLNLYIEESGGTDGCATDPCNPVPEPSSYGMVLAGLAALAAVKRRRSR